MIASAGAAFVGQVVHPASDTDERILLLVATIIAGIAIVYATRPPRSRDGQSDSKVILGASIFLSMIVLTLAISAEMLRLAREGSSAVVTKVVQPNKATEIVLLLLAAIACVSIVIFVMRRRYEGSFRRTERSKTAGASLFIATLIVSVAFATLLAGIGLPQGGYRQQLAEMCARWDLGAQVAAAEQASRFVDPDLPGSPKSRSEYWIAIYRSEGSYERGGARFERPRGC